ncbi:aldo/keto reductase [Emticicia sp. C21]|uniref:aldo/keto reductase n=1 Tax=Emticicia sp. C21 TaxID=2302915 RepID=UPI000E3493C2|nr:aldo/keto reductase [Emticicia sp. C21]RFS14121.1 aldo/keto reductase [Emticicia sp. C21]
MQNQQLMTSLNNGVQMPLLGLGVYDMYKQEAEQAVLWALETGYRLIDTASMYRNETEIGNAVLKSNIDRKDLFITTKVNNGDQGYEKTLKAFDVSLQKLNLDYVDLYLVHWPIKYTRKFTWKALERLYHEGRIRAIGVANYLIPFLEELSLEATEVPMVNQVEFSPYLYLEDLLKYCRERKIQLQAYSPLVRGQRMADPKLLRVAEKYQKTSAQIILRWALQSGVSTIPKSSNLERLKENFDVFDFEISEQDMAYINSFNENFRVVDDPMELL